MPLERAVSGGVALTVTVEAEERLADDESRADCEPDPVAAALADVENSSEREFVGRALTAALRDAECVALPLADTESWADGRALALANADERVEKDTCEEILGAADSEPVLELVVVAETVRDSQLMVAAAESDAECVGDEDADGETDTRLDVDELIVSVAADEREWECVICADVDGLTEAVPPVAETVARRFVAVGDASVDADVEIDERGVADAEEDPDAIQLISAEKEMVGLEEPRAEALTARGETDAVPVLRTLAETLGERGEEGDDDGEAETRGVRDTVEEMRAVTEKRGLQDGEFDVDGEGVAVTDRRVDGDSDVDAEGLFSSLVVAD